MIAITEVALVHIGGLMCDVIQEMMRKEDELSNFIVDAPYSCGV